MLGVSIAQQALALPMLTVSARSEAHACPASHTLAQTDNPKAPLSPLVQLAQQRGRKEEAIGTATGAERNPGIPSMDGHSKRIKPARKTSPWGVPSVMVGGPLPSPPVRLSTRARNRLEIDCSCNTRATAKPQQRCGKAVQEREWPAQMCRNRLGNMNRFPLT